MNDVKMIENYLMWKRDKELYPPQWTPEEWADELLKSEARVRLNLIKDLYENSHKTELDPIEFSDRVSKLIYDPLEELMDEPVSMGTGG